MKIINNGMHKAGMALIGMASLLITSTPVYSSNAEEGDFYFGVGFTESDTVINSDNTKALNNINNQSGLDDEGFGLQLFAGMRMDDHLSLEIGYAELGSVQIDDANVVDEYMNIDQFYLDAVIDEKLTSSVNMFVKVGIAYWNLYDPDGEDIATGSDLHYGAGFDINLFEGSERTLRVKWEHQEYDNLYLSDTDSISASLIFNF